MSTARPDGPTNWGAFGADDELGTLNLQTAERVVAAAACVRTGERFPLNLPLHEPEHPDTGQAAMKPDVAPYARHSFRLNLESNQMVMNDDAVSFPTQGSSQWDSLVHIGMDESGVSGVFYNGRTREALDADGAARRGGIDAFARAGIVGRGVLLDIARLLTGGHGPLDRAHVITTEETECCAAEQGVQVRAGDVVCFRTGWTEAYLAAGLEQRRAILSRTDGAPFPQVPGIDPGHAAMAQAQGWSAVAADNVAVEALPMPPGPQTAHVRMLRNLGLPFAELLDFDALSRACLRDRRWEFLFVAVPLYIPGGIGSPANAIAIR